MNESINALNQSLNEADRVTKGKLIDHLQTVIADAEQLLRATAGQVGEQAAIARERIQASLSVAKDKLVVAEQALIEKSKEAARAADAFVHERPWSAIGIAAAAGVVLGLLISRR